MVRLQETQERYFVTIPKGLVNKKRWKKGQDLLLILNEKCNIEIIDNV